LYRGINDFKKFYQPKTNIVKDENGDFVTHYHRTFARWRNQLPQLLNAHGIREVRQVEILVHTAGPIMP
jgi:hypothetical protein